MRVRPVEHSDDAMVRQIFRSTLLLGDALPFSTPGMDRYESLCLDWYLGPARGDAGVLEADDGSVVGYALVCTDVRSNAAWTRRRAIRFALSLIPGFVTGRYRGEAARFYRLRLRDGWSLRGSSSVGLMPAHAHVNLLPSHRAGQGGRLLADHVDARVRRAGLPGWFGEINAMTGHRARALERLGGKIMHRAPNRTLSALLHMPVERLTVVRTLP